MPLICQKINVTESSNLNDTILVDNSTNATNLTSLEPVRSYEQVWCDDSKMEIDCSGSNQNITILCGFYGLHPSLTSFCNLDNNLKSTGLPVCYFESSLNVLKTFCDGKMICNLDVKVETFPLNPCVGMEKALYVQWTCS